MTDTPPTPPQPATPPPAGAYAPAAAGPKQTQSLVGFILGIASIVFCSLGLIGVGLGIAAIILSNKGKKSEPGAPSWMHTAGLITGIVGIVLSVIVGIAVFASAILPLIFLSNYSGAYYS